MTSCGFQVLDKLAITACDPENYKLPLEREFKKAGIDFEATSPQSRSLFGRASEDLDHLLVERRLFNSLIELALDEEDFGTAHQALYTTATDIQAMFARYVGNFGQLSQFLELQAREVLIILEATVDFGGILSYLDLLDSNPHSIDVLEANCPSLCDSLIGYLKEREWIHPSLKKWTITMLIPGFQSFRDVSLLELHSRIHNFVQDVVQVSLASLLVPENSPPSLRLGSIFAHQRRALLRLDHRFEDTDDEPIIQQYFEFSGPFESDLFLYYSIPTEANEELVVEL